MALEAVWSANVLEAKPFPCLFPACDDNICYRQSTKFTSAINSNILMQIGFYELLNNVSLVTMRRGSICRHRVGEVGRWELGEPPRQPHFLSRGIISGSFTKTRQPEKASPLIIVVSLLRINHRKRLSFLPNISQSEAPLSLWRGTQLLLRSCATTMSLQSSDASES
jgi:hypothetical protein